LTNISNVINILIAILVFGVIIFLHELGHFVAAKLCHIKVNQFAIGMGPAFLKIQRGETLYALRILPIGGFCAMEGEDDDSHDDRAFGHKPIWQRAIVLVAGAFMNILTGFIIMLIITCMSQAIATNVVAQFDKTATSNASGGMQVGDTITSINGATIHVSSDIMYDLILSNNGVADIQVKRAGKLVNLNDVHFPMISDGNGGKLMQRDFWVKGEQKTVINVLHESFFQTISMVRLVWMTFVELVKGRFGLKDLAGPIGTTAAVGQAAAAGIPNLMFVAALIAVNLGVVNLFPLPALDGGRLLFLVIEGIRRKPINPKYEGYVHFAGFALLMLLMVVVSYNDIIRLIKG
jgi:regulator of sigma E protease